MTILIFVRHGETDWSRTREHRFRGRSDIPLNFTGIKQAKAVGKQLDQYSIDAIYSSPLLRAMDTAKEIAKLQGLSVQDHEGFIDLDFGSWEGRLHSEIRSEFPELYNKWISKPNNFRFPGGESLNEFRARIETVLNEMVMLNNKNTIVISTHGAVLRIAFCVVDKVSNNESWNYNMDNCSYTIVKHQENKYSIEVFNYNAHLKE